MWRTQMQDDAGSGFQKCLTDVKLCPSCITFCPLYVPQED